MPANANGWRTGRNPMSNDQAHIFDRKLLQRRRERFASGFGQHDFLLQRVAEDLVSRLDAITRDFTIAADLGTHHGIVADMVAESPRVGTMVKTDISPRLLQGLQGLRVACDEEALPFRDASLDLVVSGLSLQHVNDLPGTLVQVRRALRPDGLFLAAVMGGRTLHELREAMAIAEEEICGGVSPRVAPFGDVRDYGALLQRAGFALPVSDSDLVTVTYETALHLMRDLRAMGASNTLAARRRVPATKRLLYRASEVYAERHGMERGRVRATFEVVHLAGWVPHDSQQEPLRPGSARTRLADALGTEEIATGEKAKPGPGRR